jgi:hypothetical protein
MGGVSMTEEHNQALRQKYVVLVGVVEQLCSKGKSLDDAWLLAGAIYAYTGIASIPDDIVLAAGARKGDYPKVVGQINDFLRGKSTGGSKAQNEELLALLTGIEALPDWNSGSNDPTRMMDAYDKIDRDYKVGNIVIMAEVGSVSRHRPAPGLYDKQYRLHFEGGLKDISAINPQQREVLYAPSSAYQVWKRETGKTKVKKGNQAHEHIYLRYISKDSAEYKKADAAGKVLDLGDATRHGQT